MHVMLYLTLSAFLYLVYILLLGMLYYAQHAVFNQEWFFLYQVSKLLPTMRYKTRYTIFGISVHYYTMYVNFYSPCVIMHSHVL